MPVLELTDRFVKTAKAEDGERQTDYFDTIVRGLSLRASSGGARVFYLAFTRPDGRRARIKIGRYGDDELTLGKARIKAREMRSVVADGNDPIAAKRARITGQTVTDLVENYLARSSEGKRTAEAIARRLRKNVSGRGADGEKLEQSSSGCMGEVKLADLHRRDLTRCIDAVADRGARVEANRVFEDLRAMIRWARGRGDLDQNLTEGMRKPTETAPRERVLSPDEIRTMWKALADAGMRESTRRILRLCLVTGQRVGEVAGMARAELDLENQMWTIPSARAKNGRQHVVPLSGVAVKIIRDQIAEADALATRMGRQASTYVFPGPGDHGATTGHAIAKAVKREETKDGTTMGIASWTPHDLRRTAATRMEEIGISPFIVGHLLNHATVTEATITSKVYARYDYAREKREALDLWADRLDGIISGTANVTHMRRTAKA
jgi:integrase